MLNNKKSTKCGKHNAKYLKQVSSDLVTKLYEKFNPIIVPTSVSSKSGVSN